MRAGNLKALRKNWGECQIFLTQSLDLTPCFTYFFEITPHGGGKVQQLCKTGASLIFHIKWGQSKKKKKGKKELIGIT